MITFKCYELKKADCGGQCLTYAVSPIRCELESCVTDALKTALCIQTAAVLTQHPILKTLVNVYKQYHHRSEYRFTI